MIRLVLVVGLGVCSACSPCAPGPLRVQSADASLARTVRQAYRTFRATSALDVCVSSVRVSESPLRGDLPGYTSLSVRRDRDALVIRAPSLRAAHQATTEGLCALALDDAPIYAPGGWAPLADDARAELVAWCGWGADALALLGDGSCGDDESLARVARDLVYLPVARPARRFVTTADASLGPVERVAWRGGGGVVELTASPDGAVGRFHAATGTPLPNDVTAPLMRLPAGLPPLVPEGFTTDQRDAWSWARTSLVPVQRDGPRGVVSRYVFAEGTQFVPVHGVCPRASDAAFPLDDALWLGRLSSDGALWGRFDAVVAP